MALSSTALAFCGALGPMDPGYRKNMAGARSRWWKTPTRVVGAASKKKVCWSSVPLG